MQATQSHPTERSPKAAKSSIELISDGLFRLGHGPSDIVDKIIKVAQALCALPGVEPEAAMLEAIAMEASTRPGPSQMSPVCSPGSWLSLSSARLHSLPTPTSLSVFESSQVLQSRHKQPDPLLVVCITCNINYALTSSM